MSALLLLLAVFVAASIISYALITRVPPKLHTPLMSLTNAISAITVLGAILVFTEPNEAQHVAGGFRPAAWEYWVGGIALLAVAFNLSGGFVLTHRILRMFRE